MKLIPPKTSKALEVQYFRYLLSILSKINDTFNSVVLPVAKQPEEIQDSQLLSLEDALKAFEIKVNLSVPPKKIKKIATDVTNRNVKRNKKVWRDKLNPSYFGVNIAKKLSFEGEQDYIRSRISTNTILITKMKDEYIDQLNVLVLNKYQKGTTNIQLAKELEKQFGINKSKAKLIARNETKNTNTQLNNKQALSLGFSKAVWLGSEDEREREQHNKHNNKEYDIGVGLSDGNGGKEQPGDAILCRCTFYINT